MADQRPIGVIGGSFDPVHDGHLALARVCLDAGEAERILLVPAAQAPLRTAPAASPQQRLEMCRLAVAGDASLEVSDLEVKRRRAYTVDTLERLSELCPGRRLALIIGTDLLAELVNWRDVPGILARAQILAVARGGYGNTAIPAWVKAHRGELRVIRADTPAISSTLVRDRIAAGKSIDRLVPAPVARFIRCNRLYCNGSFR